MFIEIIECKTREKGGIEPSQVSNKTETLKLILHITLVPGEGNLRRTFKQPGIKEISRKLTNLRKNEFLTFSINIILQHQETLFNIRIAALISKPILNFKLFLTF